jgi:regulator of replication initiation timing
MLATTTNMDDRLDKLETGVDRLDKRVGEIDAKLGHVIQLNQEMMIQSNEGFRNMHSSLELNKEILQKSINKIKSQYTSKFQLYLFGLILLIWTIFVAFILLS